MQRFLVALLVLTLGWASYAFGAKPDLGTQPTAKVKAAVQAVQEVMKASKDGFAAMRDIRAARIAIFNGDPQKAIEMMGQAQTALDTASKDESMFVSDVKTVAGAKAAADIVKADATDWIPIDGQVTLAETFVPTAENKQHIAKANEHFKSGRAKEAIEELRLGNIDVNYTRVLISLGATKQCVADATRLAEEQKYYEANLALKTAEDAIIVDSVGLAGVPASKSEPTGMSEEKTQD